MNKKISLAFFWLGVAFLIIGGLLFASLLLNFMGLEFDAFFWMNSYISGGAKFLIALSLFIIGLIIARLFGKKAGKLSEKSSFKDRLKQSLRS